MGLFNRLLSSGAGKIGALTRQPVRRLPPPGSTTVTGDVVGGAVIPRSNLVRYGDDIIEGTGRTYYPELIAAGLAAGTGVSSLLDNAGMYDEALGIPLTNSDNNRDNTGYNALVADPTRARLMELSRANPVTATGVPPQANPVELSKIAAVANATSAARETPVYTPEDPARVGYEPGYVGEVNIPAILQERTFGIDRPYVPREEAWARRNIPIDVAMAFLNKSTKASSPRGSSKSKGKPRGRRQNTQPQSIYGKSPRVWDTEQFGTVSSQAIDQMMAAREARRAEEQRLRDMWGNDYDVMFGSGLRE